MWWRSLCSGLVSWRGLLVVSGVVGGVLYRELGKGKWLEEQERLWLKNEVDWRLEGVLLGERYRL